MFVRPVPNVLCPLCGVVLMLLICILLLLVVIMPFLQRQLESCMFDNLDCVGPSSDTLFFDTRTFESLSLCCISTMLSHWSLHDLIPFDHISFAKYIFSYGVVWHGLIESAVRRHRQVVNLANGLPDWSHQPSWVSRMRQHVANGARGFGPWHKLVSRPLHAKL